MLNDKIKGEWRTKVKGIFTESQKKYEDEAGAPDLDLGADTEEDPAATNPVDDAVPGAIPGEVEEEPTVLVTASLLKALLDYFAAPDEEILDAPVAEPLVNSSMTAPANTTNTGIMENDEVSPPVAGVEPSEPEIDDALAGDEEEAEMDLGDEGDVSADQVVQRLIDLSAEKAGEPLDVDVLAVVFAPEAEEGGEDLGDGELDGNVQLPATTGAQTLPPVAPDPVV